MSSASTAYPAAAAYNKAYPAIPAHHQETVAPAAIAPPTVAPTEVATDNGTSKPKTGGKRKGGPSTEEPDEKRARFLEKNRQAASKCRQKKKAQIKELERRAEVEAERNRELQRMVAALRDELIVIKGQLLDHGECGCPVIQRWTASAQVTIFIIHLHFYASPSLPTWLVVLATFREPREARSRRPGAICFLRCWLVGGWLVDGIYPVFVFVYVFNLSHLSIVVTRLIAFACCWPLFLMMHNIFRFRSTALVQRIWKLKDLFDTPITSRNIPAPHASHHNKQRRNHHV